MGHTPVQLGATLGVLSGGVCLMAGAGEPAGGTGMILGYIESMAPTVAGVVPSLFLPTVISEPSVTGTVGPGASTPFDGECSSQEPGAA